MAAFGLLYAQSADHSIFQVSTFHALMHGKYDGETTFEELKKHGNFGIGTVTGLDGEVVALNGEFFQIKADGRVYSIAEQEKTPFAVVTFFKPDKRFSLPLVSARTNEHWTACSHAADGDLAIGIAENSNM
jgi:acetolactate decarboxylase